MLIAVVSDTHRDDYALEKILKKIDEADVLIHLGDNVEDAEKLAKKFKGRMLYVRGNCDFGADVKSEMIEQIQGKRIFITHGNRYDVKYGIHTLRYKAEEIEADIVLFGHTHKSLIQFEQGIYYINPGSASEARDSCESMAFVEIDDLEVRPYIEPV